MSTEEKIKKSAFKLFLEKGFDRTSIRDIAEKAKINIALLNYYFRSKQNLFDSIFSGLLDKYTPELCSLLNKDLSLEDKIRQYISKYMDILMENSELVFFILSVLHRDHQKISDMSMFKSLIDYNSFIEQMEKEIKKGNIKPCDPHQFYLNMMSLIAFPFTIKNVISDKFEMTDEEFRNYMLERKNIIGDMLISYIKN